MVERAAAVMAHSARPVASRPASRADTGRGRTRRLTTIISPDQRERTTPLKAPPDQATKRRGRKVVGKAGSIDQTVAVISLSPLVRYQIP